MGIVLEALGADAARLHPQLRRRFGAGVAAGYSCVGEGVMDRIWHRGWARPFLLLGAWRNILVPRSGTGVPFTVENFAYVDGFGRESLGMVRTFTFSPTRRGRFDGTLVGDGPGRVLNYLGTHQHLAVDMRVRALPDGSLEIRTGAQRFHEGPLSFGVPRLLTGTGLLHESFDDERGRFVVRVTVRHPVLGEIAGDRGTFTCRYPEIVGDAVPVSVRPVREERRR